MPSPVLNISNEGLYILGYSELSEVGTRTITLKSIRRHPSAYEALAVGTWRNCKLDKNENLIYELWKDVGGRITSCRLHPALWPIFSFRKYIDFDKWDEQKALNILTVPLPTSARLHGLAKFRHNKNSESPPSSNSTRSYRNTLYCTHCNIHRWKYLVRLLLVFFRRTELIPVSWHRQ